MKFRTAEMIRAVSTLINMEEGEVPFDVDKFEKGKRTEGFLAKRAHRPTNIVYLRQLRERLKETQTESSILALIKEVEGIQINQHGFRTVRSATLLAEYGSTPIHLKGNENTESNQVVLSMRKKAWDEDLQQPIRSLKQLHDELNAQLASLHSANEHTGTLTIGVPDDKGQIHSPGIDKFVADSTASSNDSFINDQNPTALVDFQRHILMNGKKFSVNISATALKEKIVAYLSTSEKIRNDPETLKALCNLMLKNGQALQTVFTNEYDPDVSRVSSLSMGNDACMIAQNVPYYNWYLKNDVLCLDVVLDMKSVIIPDKPSFPLILDNNTGTSREIDPEKEDAGNCQTIIKYKTHITVETKTQALAADAQVEGKAQETVAIPNVSAYDVTVFNENFHYTPPLAQYQQLDIPRQPQAEAPAQAPAKK